MTDMDWLRAMVPALAVGVGALVGYGRLQERQKAQGEVIAEIKANQVPRPEIQALIAGLTTQLGAVAGALTAKIDDVANTVRLTADPALIQAINNVATASPTMR